MERDVKPGSIWNDPSWRVVIWVVLLGAFSPVLLDLLKHIESHPWTRTVLIVPWLVWVASRSNPAPRRTPSTLAIWGSLLFALVFELLAVSGDALRIARVGLAVGLVGLVWGARWAKLVPALLLLWVIPLPTILFEALSPGLEQLFGTFCAWVVPGVDFEVEGRSLALSGANGMSLVLTSADGGLALLVGLAGIGWFRAAVEGVGVFAAIGRAVRWCILWIPIQIATILAGGVLLSAGEAAGSVRWMLDHSQWVLILMLGVMLSLRPLCSDLGDREEVAPC